MTPEMALAFVGTLLVLVLVPRPDILMVVGRSLTSDFRSTFSLVVGILLGDLSYIALVFTGLAALGQILGEFFVVVRVSAALFLIYWGIALWRKDPNKPPSATVAEPGDAFTSFVTGFGIKLGDPKPILFHLGFLPTFFDLPARSLLDAVTIMVIFVVVIGTVLAFYAYAAGQSRRAGERSSTDACPQPMLRYVADRRRGDPVVEAITIEEPRLGPR